MRRPQHCTQPGLFSTELKHSFQRYFTSSKAFSIHCSGLLRMPATMARAPRSLIREREEWEGLRVRVVLIEAYVVWLVATEGQYSAHCLSVSDDDSEETRGEW